MAKLLIFIGIVFCNFFAKGQFNDTIFYNSGNFNIAEVISFDDKQIVYYTKTEKGDTLKNSDGIFLLVRFVCYDANNILQYDSKNIPAEIFNIKMENKYPDSLDISRHEISINPVMPVLLSFSGFHKFNFGHRRKFALISRLIYTNAQSFVVFSPSALNFGTGLMWTPYRNKRISFGLDYSMLFGIEYFESDGFSGDLIFTLPASINLDFYISRLIGLRFDVGFYDELGDGFPEFLVRGYAGILFLFPNKKRVATNY